MAMGEDLSSTGNESTRASNIKPAHSPLRRRNRGLPNALGSLHPNRGIDVGVEQSKLAILHKISLSLVRFNFWTLDTWGSATAHSLISSDSTDWEDFDQILSESSFGYDPDQESLDYMYEVHFKSIAMQSIDQLSLDKIEERVIEGCELDDWHQRQHYAQLMQLRMKLYRIAYAELTYAEKDPNSGRNSSMSRAQYLASLQLKSMEECHRLKVVTKEYANLHDHIKYAREHNLLEESIIVPLALFMEALHFNFDDASNLAENDPENQLKQDFPSTSSSSRTDSPPLNAAVAYQPTANTTSTLLFIVPTVSLLSCIPAAIAWSRTPSSSLGTVNDANFYQLLSSSIIQLLSLATLIWPTVFHVRVSRLTWVWTWVLAFMSACCTVVAIPCYIFVPVAWSTLLAFGGSIAQGLVGLQLTLSIR